MEDTVVRCLVCGDRSSGRHYGVLTCDGCRGFFKRSVRRNLDYACRESNECVIDVGRRNQCQACRMKKCLSVGMRREAVQHEREPRKLKERKTPTWCPPCQQPHVNTVEQLKHPHPQGTPLTPPLTPKQMHVGTSANEIYLTSLRVLYEVITWARNVPTFTSLPFTDQTLLLERSWSDMFLLGLARWNVPVEIDILLELGCSKIYEEIPEVTDDLVSELLRLKTIIQKFNVMKLDSVEYSCVKAIILFKPDMRGIDSYIHVGNLQDQAQVVLQDYTTSRGHRSRFGRILLKLPLLCEISPILVERSFFKGKLEYINEDVWKRNNITPNSPSSANEFETEEELKVDVEY